MEKEKWDYDNAEKFKFSRKKETIKYVNIISFQNVYLLCLSKLKSFILREKNLIIIHLLSY